MATQLRELTDEVQSEEYSCIEESDLAELRERIRVELLGHRSSNQAARDGSTRRVITCRL